MGVGIWEPIVLFDFEVPASDLQQFCLTLGFALEMVLLFHGLADWWQFSHVVWLVL